MIDRRVVGWTNTNTDGATVPKMSRQAEPTSPGVRMLTIALPATSCTGASSSSRASNRARHHHPTHGRDQIQTNAEEEKEDAEAA
eukprot:CAMPEP_0182558172 /NCGR_PEP_ID=MMETSP1324-20130603/1826_1 /TAXON_ID=236786 /ORGANISM="Florenciella sp., Strain RCC1587" /LENGTH=84 /DNA_ID=CAMNT_0024770337 /DNA_START=146 /DNA_END=397 /DNA_ORIENTATION=-